MRDDDIVVHKHCGRKTRLPDTFALGLRKNKKVTGAIRCAGCGAAYSATEFEWLTDGKNVGGLENPLDAVMSDVTKL